MRKRFSQMRATLQSNFSKLPVDMTARTITGVKLLENNKDVTYKGPDGKPMSFRTNDGLISGLIGHAGNRTIPAHLTHSWSDGKQDALLTRVGGHKNVRKSDSGDLIADFHAMPGIDGDRMLWLAENDPEHAMLSIIFDYNVIKSDGVSYAVPLNFEAGDFVARGAGVTAMLTANPTDTDMTKEEITQLLDERITAALSKLVIPKTDGLITAEESDKRVKAALAEFKPDKMTDAELDAVLIKAEAKLVAKLGSGPLQTHIGNSERVDKYKATLTKFEETHPNKASAIQAMLSKHPELGPIHEEHLQMEIAKLRAA